LRIHSDLLENPFFYPAFLFTVTPGATAPVLLAFTPSGSVSSTREVLTLSEYLVASAAVRVGGCFDTGFD
jgi:hypothetical protein